MNNHCISNTLKIGLGSQMHSVLHFNFLIVGECPSSRWIVNFDNDFLDGLVLASVLAAYAPFIVSHDLVDLENLS